MDNSLKSKEGYCSGGSGSSRAGVAEGVERPSTASSSDDRDEQGVESQASCMLFATGEGKEGTESESAPPESARDTNLEGEDNRQQEGPEGVEYARISDPFARSTVVARSPVKSLSSQPNTPGAAPPSSPTPISDTGTIDITKRKNSPRLVVSPLKNKKGGLRCDRLPGESDRDYRSRRAKAGVAYKNAMHALYSTVSGAGSTPSRPHSQTTLDVVLGHTPPTVASTKRSRTSPVTPPEARSKSKKAGANIDRPDLVSPRIAALEHLLREERKACEKLKEELALERQAKATLDYRLQQAVAECDGLTKRVAVLEARLKDDSCPTASQGDTTVPALPALREEVIKIVRDALRTEIPIAIAAASDLGLQRAAPAPMSYAECVKSTHYDGKTPDITPPQGLAVQRSAPAPQPAVGGTRSRMERRKPDPPGTDGDTAPVTGGTRTSETSKSRRRPARIRPAALRPTALVVKATADRDYAAILKLLRERVRPETTRILGQRRSRAGDMILAIDDSGDNLSRTRDELEGTNF